ncbi:MAG TPA: DNA polymerase III subunit gamma/tau, partial [Anaerolineales bacterium]
MSQALYRKWRPQSWDAVIGQEHVVQTLRNALAAGRTAHAYLFAGPRGTGKTTTARLLAKAVNCLDEDLTRRPCGQCDHCRAVNDGRFLDLIEIDAASNTSVEDVRDLRDKINFSPNQGRYKVYIVDEVHMLSTAAFNALLKTLEEPPSHAIFILATTEVHKIPATVLSRCQRHEFRRIPVNEITTELKKLAQGEGIQIEAEALNLVARQSTGAMRDAISLLDQLASTGQVITLQMAQNVLGTATSQAVLDVVNALLGQEPKAGLDRIHAALDAGSDPRQFARQVVDYLRDLLLVRTGNADQIDATAEARAQMAVHAQAFTTTELLRVIRVFNHAGNEARAAWNPALPLEMAFVEALEGLPQAHRPGASRAAPAGYLCIRECRHRPALPRAAAPR